MTHGTHAVHAPDAGLDLRDLPVRLVPAQAGDWSAPEAWSAHPGCDLRWSPGCSCHKWYLVRVGQVHGRLLRRQWPGYEHLQDRRGLHRELLRHRVRRFAHRRCGGYVRETDHRQPQGA